MMAVSTLVPRSATAVSLVDEDTGKEVPGQIQGSGMGRQVLWLEDELAPGKEKRYRLRYVLNGPKPDASVAVAQPKGDSVEVTVGGQLFTRYIFQGAPKPYLYPLMGPTGKPLNRDYPMKEVAGEDQDHPHQRCLWFTHGAVNGVDYWTEGTGKGRIVHRRFTTLEGGPLMGRIVVESDWVDPKGARVLQDTREVRILRTPLGPVMDFQVVLKPVDGPVTFGDTKEGTFGFRVASTMDVTRKQGGRIVTSRGLKDVAAWGKPAEWVDYSGPVDGARLGLAIMDHPDSFRHPTPWHVRDYGLFAANPFGLHDFDAAKPEHAGDFVLEKGKSVLFRYRLYPHKGDESESHVAEVYAGYSQLPQLLLGGAPK
jgi:hypothetical protein